MDTQKLREEISLIMGEGLTPKHYSAISMLVYSNLSKKEIAKELEITEQTLYNWISNPRFQKQLSMQSYLRFQRTNEELGKSYIEFIKAVYDSQREILVSGTSTEKLELLKLLTAKYDFTQIPQTKVTQNYEYNETETKLAVDTLMKQVFK